MKKYKRKYFHHRLHGHFELNLTAMVDMMTLLLVFLLKSYSTSAVVVEMHKDLLLPTSSSQAEAIEAVKVIVSRDAVYLDDQKLIDLKDGHIQAKDTDPQDNQAIKAVFEALEKNAKKTREIASQNSTVEFDGKMILQADQNIAYGELKKIVYTAMLAGYGNLKLATIVRE